jgi:hypothetical protein
LDVADADVADALLPAACTVAGTPATARPSTHTTPSNRRNSASLYLPEPPVLVTADFPEEFTKSRTGPIRC